MTTISNYTPIMGRLGNQLIRNVSISFIAEKHNLYVDYSNYNLIEKLGIKLFIGEHKYDNTINLTDDNYFSILNNPSPLKSNLNPNHHCCYLQKKENINMIYDYLHKDNIKQNIIGKNPFKERYNTNNDLFIHIRLGDTALLGWNPGIEYYLKAISNIQFDNLYISTDTKDHSIIKQLIEKYPKTIITNYDEINTFQFGSTCKHIVLSHGSFSAIIGYLSFFSDIYYPSYEWCSIRWHGDMFSIPGWNKIGKNNE